MNHLENESKKLDHINITIDAYDQTIRQVLLLQHDMNKMFVRALAELNEVRHKKIQELNKVSEAPVSRRHPGPT